MRGRLVIAAVAAGGCAPALVHLVPVPVAGHLAPGQRRTAVMDLFQAAHALFRLPGTASADFADSHPTPPPRCARPARRALFIRDAGGDHFCTASVVTTPAGTC